MKKWILPMAGLVVLIGLAATALLLGWFSVPGMSSGATAATKKEGIGPVVKLNTLVLNLKDEGGRSYLKTTIALELSGKDRIEDVNKRIPLLTDLVILTLGDKRLEDLKRPESKEGLKEEILSKMNQQFQSKTIKSLYFDEFLYE